MGFGSPCIVSSGLLVQESKTLTFMEVGISWLKLSLSDLESYNLLSLFFSLNYFRIDGVSIDIITQGVAISIKTLRSSR